MLSHRLTPARPPAFSRWIRGGLAMGIAATAALSSCMCQDKADADAKKRLLEPVAVDPLAAKAAEKLDVHAVDSDENTRRRINRMPFGEVTRRVKSMKLHSEGILSFDREGLKIKSSEVVDLVQAKEGDFSFNLVTGDKSTQEVAFVNNILFLKNNNGRWRISRDPTGERETLREDSAGVWRSFYDLFNHALVFEEAGTAQHAGRQAVRYKLAVKNVSAEARELGKNAPQPDPAPPSESDAGVEKVDPKVENKKMMGRMAAWRKSARAESGRGEILVDEQTGVLLKVDFQGAILVGDALEPAKLEVRVKYSLSDVGTALDVPAPKKAVDEITREKFPVAPRKVLEKKGLVKPEVAAPKTPPAATTK